jgi:putative membrane protein
MLWNETGPQAEEAIMTTPRRPTTFRLDEADIVETMPAADDLIHLDDPAALPPVPLEPRSAKRWKLGRIFWSGLGVLGSLALGLAVTHLVEDLFARADWLGWVGLGVAVITALAGIAFVVREILAIRRLAAIDDLRADALDVLRTDELAGGKRIVERLMGLYAAVPETARGRAAVTRHASDIFDGADLLRLSEREVLAPLDAAAARAVAQAAQRVSIVTAVAPRAVIDVVVVAGVSISLIRRIATIYGARPGTLGFFTLLRHVMSHLAVTGGMAAGESMLDQVVGHGLAARISAKLGEGVINGILTARVGLAAMAVCRPLPFEAVRAPTVRDVAGKLFERTAAKTEA